MAGATHQVRDTLGANHADLPTAKLQDENGRRRVTHDGKGDKALRTQEEIDRRGAPARTPADTDNLNWKNDYAAVTALRGCHYEPVALAVYGHVSVRTHS